ncbi:MAG: trigger factor [Gammaproteobacteria bacterium]
MFGINKKKTENKLTLKLDSSLLQEQYNKKIEEQQRSSNLKGYRKGKAPKNVIEQYYGDQITSQIIYEGMTNTFYKKISEDKISVVGQPQLNPLTMDIKKDIKFEAIYESYPEFTLKKFSSIKYKKPIASLLDADLDNSILQMQKRFGNLEKIDESVSDGKYAKIDFEGYLNEELFEGGAAKDYLIEIGSNNMIPGFEEGLIGLKVGDEKDLNINFPDDYHAEDLKGKPVKFKIKVNEVLETSLPELNKDFFSKIGIDVETTEEFKKDLKVKLEKDLEVSLKRKEKERLFDSLEKLNPIEIPSAMVMAESENLRKSAAQQMGMDISKIKDEELPLENFSENATKRVRLGVILNKIIEDNDLKSNPELVKELIEERSSGFKDPEQYKNWIYGNEEQLKNIESLALEEQVTDLLISQSKSEEENLSFEEVMTMG